MISAKPWLYFGALRGSSGHALYDTDLNRVRDLLLERLIKFDGLLPPQPEATYPPYQAAITRLGGWGYVALAWWDRSIDRRPGSSSTIFVPGAIVDPEAALNQARRVFPAIFARQPQVVLF